MGSAGPLADPRAPLTDFSPGCGLCQNCDEGRDEDLKTWRGRFSKTGDDKFLEMMVEDHR